VITTNRIHCANPLLPCLIPTLGLTRVKTSRHSYPVTLGFIVYADGKGVGPDASKVDAIREWKAPTTQKEVRRFLGFANYYRMFIPNYSKIATPLTVLTGKGVPFS
jgi:hypothetical protein